MTTARPRLHDARDLPFVLPLTYQRVHGSLHLPAVLPQMFKVHGGPHLPFVGFTILWWSYNTTAEHPELALSRAIASKSCRRNRQWPSALIILGLLQ